jgi:preprotein translocase subunit SecY
MFGAFANSLKIKELRSRILFTAGIIVLCRIAANIPCPGVDPVALKQYFQDFGQSGGGFATMFDMFSGGALQKFAIATLGIMPYISSSIIMQLLVPVVPALEKMSREGESGRQKINQYTRYLTLVICLVQGAMAAMAMLNPGRLGLPVPKIPLVLNEGVSGFMSGTAFERLPFIAMTVIVLTCGTMILMWFGEQITERGIGQGVSIIITVNIIARMPAAVMTLWDMVASGGFSSGANFKAVHLLLLFLVFALVTAATIILTQGYRRVPIQMAQRGAGGKIKSSSTFMPLKVNFSGVMPIIFAGAILMVPGMLLRWIPFTRPLAPYFAYGTTTYMLFYGILIMAFSYFWVANQFNPIKISDDLKKAGNYIPGVRPGQDTADFLDNTMTRITLAGAIFLTALAVFPMFLYNQFRIPFVVASFFGGTSLLIMVAVVLDTLKQMESHLTMRNYEGFLKKGKIQGRRAN